MDILVLERFGYMPFGTFGRLRFPTGEMFYTVECPWESNKPYISCIPEGTYQLGLRYSPVVKRTTGGLFDEGWEVLDVPERSYIMLHPGNWPSDVQGCIAVGTGLQVLKRTQNHWELAVTHSKDAFKTVMALLDERGSWDIEITGFRPEYP